MEYLKKARKTAETNTQEAQKVVNEMLNDIEKEGEQAVRNYAAKLDNWTGDILLSDDEIKFIPSSVISLCSIIKWVKPFK